MFSQEYHFGVHKAAFEIQRMDYRNDPSLLLFERGLGIIERRLDRRGTILDVGCALGTFLKVAQGRGWTPLGVEISRHAAEYARMRHGFEMFHGELVNAPFADGTFDVITFWDVIEHVTAPRENLLKAHQLLKPDGLLLITTDNFDCLISDLGRLVYALSGGTVRYGLERFYIYDNCTYFTEGTFRSLMMGCGFSEVFYQKLEYPIEKIRTSVIERIILRSLYGLARVMDRQAQFMVIGKKTHGGCSSVLPGANVKIAGARRSGR